MILGVSHIVFGSSSIKRDVAFFKKFAYQLDFIDKSHTSPLKKKKFMRSASPSQEIAYLRKNNCIAIELINYNISRYDSFSPLHLILPLIKPEVLFGRSQIKKIKTDMDFPELNELYLEFFNEISPHLLFSSDTEEKSVSSMIIFTQNLTESKEFWIKKIGFSFKSEGLFSSGIRWLKLMIRSPISQWNADLILYESSVGDMNGYLDDTGFRCLSILTTNLEQEIRRKFSNIPINRTGIMEIQVNDKPLLAEMVKSPEGVFIEFLQLDLSKNLK